MHADPLETDPFAQRPRQTQRVRIELVHVAPLRQRIDVRGGQQYRTGSAHARAPLRISRSRLTTLSFWLLVPTEIRSRFCMSGVSKYRISTPRAFSDR